ncbi:MAG: dephospho-CoA kinase [Candidatus Glassbacteria bacterium]|nr:dephospho-CoA kinase [Candidatus Glassbacteria bacterium]
MSGKGGARKPGGPLLIGLTGNLGSGKSTVARIWREECGATVIDADRLGAEAVKPGNRALDKLVGRFGREILLPDGSLDRRLMGQIAFASPENLEALNSIVHPEIIAQLKKEIGQAGERGEEVVVVDAALIYEFGIDQVMDRVVVVDAPLELRKQRMLAKNKMDEQTIGKVVSFQLDPEELKRRAHEVIDNRGTPEELRRAALEAFGRLAGCE